MTKQALLAARETLRWAPSNDSVAEALALIEEALKDEEATNQCAETCERAKLCAVCAGGITEQEPVAWIRVHPDGLYSNEVLPNWMIEQVRKESGAWVPLYAALIAQPEPLMLTDREIDEVIAQQWGENVANHAPESHRAFARAILTKAGAVAQSDVLKDAERLDWLDKYAHIATWVDNEPTKLVIDAASGDEFTGDTWRECIDAAIAAQKGAANV